MAVSNNFSELKKQIRENNINGVYLMCGEESYLRQTYISKMADCVDLGGFEDFNKISLDGKTASVDEINDAIESFPMMSEKKLVIIRDSGIFSKPTQEKKDFWQDRFDDIPDYLVLIFDEDEIDKRNALYKKASKIGFVVEFEVLKSTDAVTWVEREVLKAKKRISKDTAGYLVSICDEGLSNIKNELDKLINYCEEEITKADVEKLCSKAIGIKIFELTDYIMSKNSDKALKILNDLKTVKEPAFKVLYLLGSSFDKMLRCSLLLKEGEPLSEIARKVGLVPFIAKKYADSSKKFSEKYLTDRVLEIAQIDMAIKNGETDDWSALEIYVTDACYKV